MASAVLGRIWTSLWTSSRGEHVDKLKPNSMLGAELARYNKRVEAGEVSRPAPPTQPPPPPQPPSLAGLQIGGVPGAVSQSLPSGGHVGLMGAMRMPARPRMGPKQPPSFAQPPILEDFALPEPSPLSHSLLDSAERPADPRMDQENADELTGGTCASPRAGLPRRPARCARAHPSVRRHTTPHR